MTKSLIDINGIGPARVEDLKELGIETIYDLRVRTGSLLAKEKLSEETGISTRLIDHCGKVADLASIDSVGIKFAEFLIDREIDSVEKLSILSEEEVRVVLTDAVEEVPDTCIPSDERFRDTVDELAENADGPCSDDWFGGLEKMRRNHFFMGKLMTARDACIEQEYVRKQDALERRTIVGTGIVYGLDIGFVINDNEATDNILLKKLDGQTISVKVDEGLAIDPFGRFIVVPPKTDPIDLELPIFKKGPIKSLYLYIFYTEELDEWVPRFMRDKPCNDFLENNMIVEGFGILLSDTKYDEFDDIAEPFEKFDDPKHKCVLLAELTIKKSATTNWVIRNISSQSGAAMPPRVYSNPKLYELIKNIQRGTNGGVQKINDVEPDDDGKIGLTSTEIEIGKNGNNVTLSLEKPLGDIKRELEVLDDLRTKIEECCDEDSDIPKLVKRVDDIDEKIRECCDEDDGIPGLNKRLEDANKRINKGDDKANEREKELEEIKNDIKKISDKVIPELSDKVDPLDAMIKGLTDKLDIINTNIKVIQQKNDDTRTKLFESVKEIKSRMVKVDEDSKAFETTILARNEELEKVNTENSDTIDKISTLMKGVTKEDISELTKLRRR